ncbi:MAG: hypothetical protein HGB18_01450 [Candidatus Moranbacteria bacterium]|nr:hypothetical protein [Candidatus Moranbacteria bacterium]
MTGNLKESVAEVRERIRIAVGPVYGKVRERALAVSNVACGKVRGCVRSTVSYGDSVVTRMTLKERLIVLFVIGLAIGFGVKTIAGGIVTIGYQDYTLRPGAGAYDLNELQRRVSQKNAESAALGGQEQEAAPEGGSCQQ